MLAIIPSIKHNVFSTVYTLYTNIQAAQLICRKKAGFMISEVA